MSIEDIKELVRWRDKADELATLLEQYSIELRQMRAEAATKTLERDEARRERDVVQRELARLKSRPAEAEIGRLDVMWQELVRERDEARRLLELAHLGRAQLEGWRDGLERERDEARAELSALRKRVVEALPYPTDDDSDESRTAEEAIEMAVAERDAAYRSRDLAIKMWDEARAEVERLRAEAAPMNEHFTAGYRDGARDAYKRGAEAMREACAKRAWDKIWDYGKRTDNLRKDFTAQAVRDALRALPLPEES